MFFKQINECMIHVVRINSTSKITLSCSPLLMYCPQTPWAGLWLPYQTHRTRRPNMLRALYLCLCSRSRRCFLFRTFHIHIFYKRNLLWQSFRNIPISLQKQFRYHWCRGDKRHIAWLKSYHNGSLAVSIVSGFMYSALVLLKVFQRSCKNHEVQRTGKIWLDGTAAQSHV